MATAAQMRKLALALPETEEKSHFEQPDFRVRNKIFAGLTTDEKRGTLKLTPEIQSTLPPEAFPPAAGAWGRSGWTHVVLSEVDVQLLRELLQESWQLVAPKTLVKEHATKQAKAPRKRNK